jgi:hypothetical protein
MSFDPQEQPAREPADQPAPSAPDPESRQAVEPDMQLYDLRVIVDSIEGRSVCGLSRGDYSVFADLLYQPPLPALLEIARTTSTVRLGAACLNPYTRHP